MTRLWRSGIVSWMSVAIALATLPLLTPVRADAADDIGVPCARAKLRAADKATSSLIKCYLAARTFGSVDLACVDRVHERMERTFAGAERLGCYGFQDDFEQVWTLVYGFVTDLVHDLAPPGGCQREGDGFTCGGLCASGSACVAVGGTCGCYADALACGPTSPAPALCPKIGQTCVDRACADPAEGYCREEPEGSGHATGFCTSDSTCLALPMGSGTVASCLPHLFGCEDPAGTCTTSGTGFGFCTDVGETCGPDCVCH